MINPTPEEEVLKLMERTTDATVYRVCQTLLELYGDLEMLDVMLEMWGVRDVVENKGLDFTQN